MNKNLICHFCETQITNHTNMNDCYSLRCENCGDYKITIEAYEDCYERSLLNPRSKGIFIRHFLFKAQQNNRKEIFKINSSWIEKVLKNYPNFPSISEQADNLLLWLGLENPEDGHFILDFNSMCHITGSKSINIFNAVANGLGNNGLLKMAKGHDHATGELTFQGWLAHEELCKGKTKGHGAFMAMKFGKEILDNIFKNHFKPAVENTGFDLKKLNDEPTAGLIDIRLKLEIKQARFIIADLTHKNAGAYWEAGYAEGLGKPVIYTCQEGVETHFDTSHYQTIFWNPDQIEKAIKNLKATIRFSIPEAKQND